MRLSRHAPRRYNSYALGAEQLGLSEADVLRRVPYRQNRAVLFTSSLFHATDTVEFKPGFETCRINFTLLFGFMDAVRCPARGVDGTDDDAGDDDDSDEPKRVPIGANGNQGRPIKSL